MLAAERGLLSSGWTTISFFTRTTPLVPRAISTALLASSRVLVVPLSHTIPFLSVSTFRRARLPGCSAASLVLMAAVIAESFTNCTGSDLSVSESCAGPITGANRDAASTQATMRFVSIDTSFSTEAGCGFPWSSPWGSPWDSLWERRPDDTAPGEVIDLRRRRNLRLAVVHRGQQLMARTGA